MVRKFTFQQLHQFLHGAAGNFTAQFDSPNDDDFRKRFEASFVLTGPGTEALNSEQGKDLYILALFFYQRA